MNYNVIAVKAMTVAKQGQNFGKKYVEVTLRSDQGDVRTTPVFDADANEYLKCIGVQNGGASPTGDTAIPESMAIWQYCFDQEFVFPEPMVRVDEQGKPMLNKFNQMYIRNSVNVMTRYQYDEQLQLLNPGGTSLAPKRGWDKTSRGTSVMNAFYVPLRTINAANGSTPVGGPAAAPATNDLP